MPPRPPAARRVTLNALELDLGDNGLFLVAELNDSDLWTPGTRVIIPVGTATGPAFLPPVGEGWDRAWEAVYPYGERTAERILSALGYGGAPALDSVGDVMAGDPAEVSLDQFRRICDYEKHLRSARAPEGQERLDEVRDRIDSILMANGFGVREWRAALTPRED